MELAAKARYDWRSEGAIARGRTTDMRSLLVRLGLCLQALLLGGCLATADELAAAQARAGSAGSPCLEEISIVPTDRTTKLGFRPDALTPFIAGMRASPFTWASGSRTWVRLSVTEVTPYYVQSRINPAYDVPYSDRRCTNHLRLQGKLTIATDDGRLSEIVSSILFIAYDAHEARGTFELARADVDGTHAPELDDAHCWRSTSFRLLFSTEGAHGSVVDAVQLGDCEGPGLGEPFYYAAGHWGSRWQNY
jgi:hypothetical protein